jgi:hypothetical protein
LAASAAVSSKKTSAQPEGGAASRGRPSKRQRR